MKNNIKKYMKAKGISIRMLAGWTKIPKTTISRYVNGERLPDIYDAIRIAEELGAAVTDVFEMEKIDKIRRKK